MTTPLFECYEYKSYIISQLNNPNRGGGWGARGRLARALKCPPSHVAQVLKGAGHFSLEHAELINGFLGHNEAESQYFLFLVQLSRAGTTRLKARFETEMRRIRENQQVLKNRLDSGSHSLSMEQQAVFYSAWYYPAILSVVAIPGFRTESAIGKRLQLDASLVADAVAFLQSTGFLRSEGAELRVGAQTSFLGSDSPLISKHHANWRLQALRSLERRHPEDLHYSSVVTLSQADTARIREMLVSAIEQARAIVRASPEERLQCLSLDFFQV